MFKSKKLTKEAQYNLFPEPIPPLVKPEIVEYTLL